MCGVDFQHHLRDDGYGTKSYPSVEELKAHRPCWPQCGIVAVRVELSRWVERQNLTGEGVSASEGSPAKKDAKNEDSARNESGLSS